MLNSERDLPSREATRRKTRKKSESTNGARRRGGRKSSPEKRLRILEAAVLLFTKRDYHEVLMEHIAEQAEVGKGTVYRYFPTKEDLFLELVSLAVDRASEVILAGINNDDSAIRRLRRAVAMTLEYFRKNEHFYSILYHDKVFRCCRERKDLDRKRAELRGLFVQLLAEGIAEGSLRSDMEPAFAAHILMAAMRTSLRSFGSERTSEQLCEQILKIFLGGVEEREEVSPRGIGRGAGARVAHEAAASHLPTLDTDTMARLDPLASLADGQKNGSDTKRASRRPSRGSENGSNGRY